MNSQCTDDIKVKFVLLVSKYMVKKYGRSEAFLRAIKKINGAKIIKIDGFKNNS